MRPSASSDSIVSPVSAIAVSPVVSSARVRLPRSARRSPGAEAGPDHGRITAGSSRELQHPVGAEAGRVGERGALRHPAAVAQGLEVGDVGARVRTARAPRPRGRRDRARAASRPGCSRRRGRARRVPRACTTNSTGTSTVMSCVPGASSGEAPRSWARKRAQPAGLAADRELGAARCVVDRAAPDPAGAAPPRLGARPWRHRAPGGASRGTRGLRRRVRPRRPGARLRAGCSRRSGRPSWATRTSSHVSAARSTTRKGRLSRSSLASTTPTTCTAGRSSSAVTIGPMPVTGTRSGPSGSSGSGAAGPSASSNGSMVSRSRCAARSSSERSTST